MKRKWLLCILIGGFAPAIAQADWGSFYHGSHMAYARNNAWPQPFTEVDVCQTRSYFAAISQNGWRAHNSLGTEVFRAEDQLLSHAGRERLRRIVLNNPPDRRVVFVTRADTSQATEARLVVVRNAIQEMELNGQTPAVLVTDIQIPSSSGAWITQVQRERMKNLPPPVLPPLDPSSAGGSGP